MRYLIDSNVIIDYLAGRFPGKQLDAIVNESLCISIITKIEGLGFVSGVLGIDEKTEQFVKLANLYDLTPEIVEQTIHIRKQYKIKMADAIIAATAIAHNFTLLSHNAKDFNGIHGITITDPYAL